MLSEKRRCLSFLAAFAALSPVPVVSAGPLWRDVDEAALRATLPPARAASAKRGVQPTAYRTLEVDLPALRERLAAAPREFVAPMREAGIEILLPLPYGDFGRFLVLESPVMEEGLATRYPEIRTYLAQGVDDPSATARLDLTARGFRAYVLSARGQFVIDPYWQDDDRICISYYQRNLPPPTQPWTCGVRGEFNPAELERALPPRRPTGANLRTYRLAVGATAEYTAAQSGSTPGNKAAALTGIVTTVNRINALYEREFAIRLVLVANTDALIFTDAATDGYTDSNPNSLLPENQAKCDSIIGSANYDIGHVFCTFGGGLASVGAVCANGAKAAGASGTTGSPNTDGFAVQIAAHEIGHQFGAPHSFNGTSSNCVNRNASTAYEVGSGSTVMAYAGICPPQNLQARADDYFHTTSYQSIDTVTTGLPSCPATTATGNSPPVIGALTNRIIPSQTPFALTASATDANGDTLTYCWEELDLGGAQDPTANPRDNGSSPILRSFEPSLSPTRVFPSLTYILNNANVPPATIGSLISGEFLPTTNRTMTFRVTVRDNRAGGGGSDYAPMTVQSVASAGPFILTAPDSGSLTAGSAFNVTWNVANTTAAPINCSNVNILFSTDGGNTFPVTLASNVANNGTRSVTIPNVASSATTQGRIKVEAVGNIFFDINNANLTVTTTNSAPTLSLTSPTVTVTRGGPAVVAGVGTASDANGPLSVSLAGVPVGATVTPSIVGADISITAQASCTCDSIPPLTLTVTDSLGATRSGTITVVVNVNPAPTLGAYAASTNVPRNGVRALSPSTAPADANGNLTASPCSVRPTALPGGGTVSVDSAGVVTVSPGAAATLGVTTLFVTVADQCGGVLVRSLDINVTAAAGPVGAALNASAPSAESCAPGNGFVDPGEFVTVSLPLRNDGSAPTVNLVGNLQPTGGITPVGSGSQNYGVVTQGQSVARSFSFIANGACGATVTATLQLQDGATSYGNISFPIVLGGTVPANFPIQNFDGVTPPALPAGWTATVASGSTGAWVTSASVSDTSPNSALSTTNGTAADTRLETPSITLTGGTNELRFRQGTQMAFIDASNAFDAGVLEVSIDGGAFVDILTAGGIFTQGGYNNTVPAGVPGSVLTGRACWGGFFGYFTTQVTLPASASGHQARFRFRASWTDSGFDGANWTIDSISLIGTAPSCTTCGAAPQFVSSAPASPVVVGSPYTHYFAATGNPTPTYSLTAGTLPPGLTLSPGGVLSGTPTNAGTGAFPNLAVKASNGVPSDVTQMFSLNAATRAGNYLASFGLSGGNAAVTADPNFDGVGNLVAYALGLSPIAGSVQFLPAVGIKSYAGVPYAFLTFNRSSVATDLTYLVEASEDLQSWTTIATSTGGATTTGPGFVSETGSAPTFLVEVRDTTPVDPITGRRRFLRFRAMTLP